MASGLLNNQVAYDSHQPVKVIFRSDSLNALNSPSHVTFRKEDSPDEHETCDWKYWGELWGDHWWTATTEKLSVGDYKLETVDSSGRKWTEPLTVSDKPYWKFSIEHIALGQFERRSMIPTAPGHGWQDCGAHLSEANSHAVSLYGMALIWKKRRSEMEESEQERLLNQIRIGGKYCLFLAEEAKKLGYPEGTYVHEPLFSHCWLLSDSLQIGVAALLAAELLLERGGTDVELAKELIKNAQVNAAFIRSNESTIIDEMKSGLIEFPPNEQVHLRQFSRHAHAVDHDIPLPSTWATRDLLLWLQFQLLLETVTGESLESEMYETARSVGSRFVKNKSSSSDSSAPACYFVPYPDFEQPEVGWCHHSVGMDTAGVFPHFTIPLWELAKRYPNHPESQNCRQMVLDFLDGYLRPAFQASPFGLLPNTWKKDQGWMFYAGLWHGMNSSYALLAMQCYYYAAELKESWLSDMARAQLEWIAGLNCGLTAESIYGCTMYHRDVEPGGVLPVSMIQGVGNRFAGSWRTIRGSICNGFSRGRQFQFDVEPVLSEDRPDAFTDEDWITHSGAWLAALAYTEL